LKGEVLSPDRALGKKRLHAYLIPAAAVDLKKVFNHELGFDRRG
jgi:hypothetical protein